MDHKRQLSSSQQIDFSAQHQQAEVGQFMGANFAPMLSQQDQPSNQNIINQLANEVQLQAMQAWAVEHNMDLSLPANAYLIPQVLAHIRPRTAPQKPYENTAGPCSLQIATSNQQEISNKRVAFEDYVHRNSSSDLFGQSGSASSRKMVQCEAHSKRENGAVFDAIRIPNQESAVHSWESHRPLRSTVNASQSRDFSLHLGAEAMQIPLRNELQQLRRSPVSFDDMSPGTSIRSQGKEVAPVPRQHIGYTEQQLNVLKEQMLAVQNFKKGEGHISRGLSQATPTLELQLQQSFVPALVTIDQGKYAGKGIDNAIHASFKGKGQQIGSSNTGKWLSTKDPFAGEEKEASSSAHVQRLLNPTKETVQVGYSFRKGEQKTAFFIGETEQDVQCQHLLTSTHGEMDKGKAFMTQNVAAENIQVQKNLCLDALPLAFDIDAHKEHRGPIFDIPLYHRETGFSGTPVYNFSNLSLAYDAMELLSGEGREVLNRERMEILGKIGGLLAVNVEKKSIRPDLIMRLQILEKKLRLIEIQASVRNEVEQQQQEIMAMPGRSYRKFVRLCERQRMELSRKVHLSRKFMREKHLQSVFQWRKKLLEAHWMVRDARITCNKGVVKYHERMLKEYLKRNDDTRNQRMEALKRNDVNRYREILLEQQTGIPGVAAQRYVVLSSFLNQTEEYLHELGEKITTSKYQQEAKEVANAAVAEQFQGLSEEEARTAATCSRTDVMIGKRFSEMNAWKQRTSHNKYYSLAHTTNEIIVKQPSLLTGGTLRDYQLVGLQWMLSLYNNNLNGILADEMGLGKTVQVMALIAYLMEFKRNNGPHLIIVPNAVLVNWKSELRHWLPSVSCIFYAGGKIQRSKIFSTEVYAMKFNVLVTTYEFIMKDCSKLSKFDWKYIIIDEAQRMKDRDSVLARDLDRYRCQRRLLLSGTPLQNDLKELWSLLNIVLPEVFDNCKAFYDWFSKPFQKDAPSHTAEDEWLETEKKVIIIHRLHQILEPFVLRRRVEDVEGSLPPKVSVVLQCRMSAIQGAIYDWVKATGSIRVDPEDEVRRVQKNPKYTARVYKSLNNKCIELRKVCNHPLLNYPCLSDSSKDFVVRSCGKLWILDRILIKLQRTGHRVLLFSTMTKLLDILEEYLEWRQLVYRRIDGTTSLEDRESAISDFNCNESECFVFLLSIRAAGRGLNLQSADTVIIYDPDPNPQNEEQAVARAHRIGQKREVKVIYMEAIVDKISSHEKEDDFRNGGIVTLKDKLDGKYRYRDSIESLIRNNIQQYKIEMADEVINAGRFDRRTSQEERRMTLEALLHDVERRQETVHDVPSLKEVNRMIARSEEEAVQFDQMDEDLAWPEEMVRDDQVPKWLRANSGEVNVAVVELSNKLSRNISLSGNIGNGEFAESSFKIENERVQPIRLCTRKSSLMFKESDYENGEFSGTSSEEGNRRSFHEENGKNIEFGDRKLNSVGGEPKKLEDGDQISIGGCGYPQLSGGTRNYLIHEELRFESSAVSPSLVKTASPTVHQFQKSGSLYALDSRSKRLEGEISVSGQFHDPEDKVKRRRTIRIHPERAESVQENRKTPILKDGDPSSLVFLGDHKNGIHVRMEPKLKTLKKPVIVRHQSSDSTLKTKPNSVSVRILPSSKPYVLPEPVSSNCTLMGVENVTKHSTERWDSKSLNSSGPDSYGLEMSEVSQRKCKNVISKIERRIDTEGHNIVPILADIWKRDQNSCYMINLAGSCLMNFKKISQCLDGKEYNSVKDFVTGVQSMLKGAADQFWLSFEVQSEMKIIHDMFFDIMESTFPDVDFCEARNAVDFSRSGSTFTLLPRQASIAQSKPRKRRQLPLSKLLRRRSLSTCGHARAQMRHLQNESPLVSSGSREASQSSLLGDSDEAVICKNKRKAGAKSALMRPPKNFTTPRRCEATFSGSNTGLGSVSLPVEEMITGHYVNRQDGQVHTPAQWAIKVDEPVGWANPVKRPRTGTRRRKAY